LRHARTQRGVYRRKPGAQQTVNLVAPAFDGALKVLPHHGEEVVLV
jgi:hypothetical protein